MTKIACIGAGYVGGVRANCGAVDRLSRNGSADRVAGLVGARAGLSLHPRACVRRVLRGRTGMQARSRPLFGLRCWCAPASGAVPTAVVPCCCCWPYDDRCFSPPWP